MMMMSDESPASNNSPSSNDPRGVALVGHCGPDAWMLQSMAKRAMPGIPIEMISSESELQAHLSNLAVLLVNRVLDGDFASDSGIELIGRLAAQSEGDVDHQARSILISNFADAQADAQQVGAFPGFGKSALNTPEAAEKLQTAYAAATQPAF